MSIGAGLSRLVSEIETVKRERDELAAALEVARHGLTYGGANEALTRSADPSACLKAHDEGKDGQIRQLRNVLAEAARQLTTRDAFEIARFLGYGGNVAHERHIDEFLSNVSVEEPKT